MPCVPAPRPLNDRRACEVVLHDSEGRVAEVEAGWRAAADLAHADLPDAGGAQGQGLLDRRDHDDARGAVGERHGGGGEGAKDVDDGDAAGRAPSAVEQAVEMDFHDAGRRSRELTSTDGLLPNSDKRTCWEHNTQH
jgi:hypothetical protein